jgi:flagellar basal body-associated protein FliL
VSNSPGKKAELDKEGISFDINKAQLDKDGIPLTDNPEAPGIRKEAALQDAGGEETRKIPPPKRKIIIVSLAAGITAICLAAGAYIALRAAKDVSEQVPVSYTNPPVTAVAPSDSDILLDPFMVLYEPRNPHESGVLLAQISLQITPGTAPNIAGRLFDIRSLIYQRLAANAEIYTKNELAAMILGDLKNLQIKDVAFVQYEKR